MRIDFSLRSDQGNNSSNDFKLRHTAKVKDLVTRMMRQGAPCSWPESGDRFKAAVGAPLGSVSCMTKAT